MLENIEKKMNKNIARVQIPSFIQWINKDTLLFTEALKYQLARYVMPPISYYRITKTCQIPHGINLNVKRPKTYCIMTI